MQYVVVEGEAMDFFDTLQAAMAFARESKSIRPAYIYRYINGHIDGDFIYEYN